MFMMSIFSRAGVRAFPFEYGSLEIDVHKNGKKYLTGFNIDPRAFIVELFENQV